ncbi:hypothetical protein CDCA_CDCA06G1825 [Cyanidium caldarium]|uniref:Electron transfer flavoprotein subunit alpha n=1 Tax=Cyanidium caldarium TaxID=2771 RepID=A0AAV9IUK5_CYACA|nr:hypothetical protein CDCA_CDCA06G1825 [Cyanidium caldarium]
MGGGLSRTRVRNVLRPFCDSGSLRPSPSVRSLATLVVGEPSQSRLSTASLRAISAAEKLESYDPATQRRIDVLLFRSAGSDLQAVAREAAGVEGVTRVLLADDERHAHGLAEVLAPAIVGVVEKYDHQRVVAGGSTFSKNVLPRVAGLLGVQPLSDVIEVVSAREYVRPVYAGNAMVRVELNESGVGAQPCSVMTVRATSFAAAKPRAPSAAGAETVLVTAAVDEALQRMPPPGSEWVSEQATPADRPALESARIVVSGGRGLRDGDHFNELIYALANKMGAAVGATRAAVDSGMCPNDMQVGQTGKIVAPELYVAIGVSGAIQHLAGMRESKVIVAINKDPEAPIFQVADYGLVADLFQAVPELIQKL